MGEWYWDELPMRSLYRDTGPGPDELMDQMKKVASLTKKQPVKAKVFQAAGRASEAAPHRAPPKDRAALIGTSSPNPPARVNRLKAAEMGL